MIPGIHCRSSHEKEPIKTLALKMTEEERPVYHAACKDEYGRLDVSNSQPVLGFSQKGRFSTDRADYVLYSNWPDVRILNGFVK